jgi:hypothetical protein
VDVLDGNLEAVEASGGSILALSVFLKIMGNYDTSSTYIYFDE